MEQNKSTIRLLKAVEKDLEMAHTRLLFAADKIQKDYKDSADIQLLTDYKNVATAVRNSNLALVDVRKILEHEKCEEVAE